MAFCARKTQPWPDLCSWSGCGACTECFPRPPPLPPASPLPLPPPTPALTAGCGNSISSGATLYCADDPHLFNDFEPGKGCVELCEQTPACMFVSLWNVFDWSAPLKNGINLDVATPSSGVWFKWQYDKSQMQAIAEAGFESVRIFMPFSSKMEEKQKQIEDALDAGLSIVVCMWGEWGWSWNVTKGVCEISNGRRNRGEGWGALARAWKGFSKRLVFEVLNEPKGIGFPTTNTGNANAMRLCNAAVQAIRSADPDRPILVGSPGLNDAEFLEYVTAQFLPYTFGSGGSFYNDPNVGVAFHFYEPRHPSIVPGLPTAQQTTFAMWDGDLVLDGPETEWRDGLKVWQAPIKLQFDFVDAWRKRSGHGDIPVVTTEWGCWMFESRSKGGDLRVWLNYTHGLFAKHDVGQMWYVGVMSNQYAYTIFDSETGWDATVLPKLTGKQPPTSWPHINQVLNGEFLSHSSDVTKDLHSPTSSPHISRRLSAFPLNAALGAYY
ncbi:hypothetical protein EMIHUDRAFT_224944 [Emiliania huxleyi CCMP1516]|uniref:Glycoside hydrolase family 5 domain-containing protein n=2 Tax=Emiliania huxleyi TaxID=2903 RepID=A0A0D3KQA8_EMIH1|nr:hypothetical protein EMIHUDRAFT_224944 [Emiliania huxleyi CCMP1516]EOD37943.1 hypothetical protein EMIHUDRAFT_224944 [Emiliania huxleyi CCMP1516]|eukprot:XP_005790372.1 hypothetical protein EMIHUDRAFT_224944 [Emiliania huxleyi CCMP1516]